jgi:hypothetical protein
VYRLFDMRSFVYRIEIGRASSFIRQTIKVSAVTL